MSYIVNLNSYLMFINIHYVNHLKSIFRMKIKLIIVAFFCLPAIFVHAQTLEEAKKLYLAGQYAKALPAFEKSIKSDPKNMSYNQWYGNCLLETGKYDQSEKYLVFAASKNVQESFRSLGKLYFIQYKFAESEEAYDKYIELLRKKKELNEVKTIEILKEKSKNAARMLSHCEDIQIIDSTTVLKKDFLKFYSILSKESGTITESNKLPVYENQLNDKRYYPKLDAKKKYRIFSQTKLQNKWVEETPVNILADSDENINYPFVLSDGVTIYYASTGQGSIGGYDIFVTRYNSSSDSYFKPEQLGMPFNSPYNDYMMAIDEYNNIGYFATDRFQPDDKVIIYTFLPNPEKISIESKDENYIRNRAKITSIKDSQKKGVNYKSKLSQIKEELQKSAEEEKKEFEFVINDNIVYYKLDDFSSHAAKQFFIQYQDLSKQLLILENQLEDKRKTYIEGNQVKKKSMTNSILSDEKKLQELTKQCNDLAIKVRNMEIKYLKSNQ